MDKSALRRANKAIFIARKIIEDQKIICDMYRMKAHDLSIFHTVRHLETELNAIAATPWQQFRHDKPELDKRRVKKCR